MRALAGHITQGYVNVAAALHSILGYRPMQWAWRPTGQGQQGGDIAYVGEVKLSARAQGGRDFNLLYWRYPQNNLAGRQNNVDDRGGQDKTPSPSGEDGISSEDEEPQDQRVWLWDNIRTTQDSQIKLT